MRQAQKAVQEIVVIAESFSSQLTAIRTFAEVVSIVDTILKQTGRSFAEIVALADSIIKKKKKVLFLF